MKEHHYLVKLEWTGNRGKGTSGYRSYSRDHMISASGKKNGIEGSSDPAFSGDSTRYNPEDLLVSSLAACHMLWYLHLCSASGIVVVSYEDDATGIMEETPDGSGRFSEVILHPRVTIEGDTMKDKAHQLHHEANRMCFIANSCNFKISHKPETVIR